jgi:hypothetical protein
MYWYYRIVYQTSEKFVKTSNKSCEIWLKSPRGNRWEQFNKPYPIWDEFEYDQISEQEFILEIGNIDLNFWLTKPPVQNIKLKSSF